jgi:hypothetical protein
LTEVERRDLSAIAVTLAATPASNSDQKRDDRDRRE